MFYRPTLVTLKNISSLSFIHRAEKPPCPCMAAALKNTRPKNYLVYLHPSENWHSHLNKK